MARSGLVNVPKRAVTELTNGDVSGDISFQLNGSGYSVLVLGTVDSTAPSPEDFSGGIKFSDGQGHVGKIEDLFPGAGFVRLWAYSPQSGTDFVVYHA